MSEMIVDGVHRYPSSGIKVVIIGAGNGGMQAALECWRKGCEVEVVERSAEISPIGISHMQYSARWEHSFTDSRCQVTSSQSHLQVSQR